MSQSAEKRAYKRKAVKKNNDDFSFSNGISTPPLLNLSRAATAIGISYRCIYP